MALFKRRHFRVVLLEWLAYGVAFGAIALIGSCQAQPNAQTNTIIASATKSEAPASEMPPETESPDVEATDDVIAPPVPEPEFSEAIRADYNSIDLGDRRIEQLSGQDPLAITEAMFGAQEAMEGNYSESSEAEVGNERALVIFTRDNLPDDSVQGILTRAEFERIDGAWQLVWAGEQYRCWAGRGHQDWSTALCS